MASLYAQYISERTDDEILETAEGYATYRYMDGGKSVYIVDIFTVPERRLNGYAAALADIVANRARERGCTEMLGSVMPSAKGSTASLRVLLAYGMTLKSAGADYIIFRKDL